LYSVIDTDMGVSCVDVVVLSRWSRWWRRRRWGGKGRPHWPHFHTAFECRCMNVGPELSAELSQPRHILCRLFSRSCWWRVTFLSLSLIQGTSQVSMGL